MLSLNQKNSGEKPVDPHKTVYIICLRNKITTMALIKLGNGITDIRGPLGGLTFTRDRSGLHLIPKRRSVNSPTINQITQRKAFIKARSFSHINREVSYNIYRALNGLEPKTPPPDFQIPDL